MREILGRRRRFTWPMRLLESMGLKTPNKNDEQACSAVRTAALTCAQQWKWPVLPGVGHERPPSRDAAAASDAAPAPPDKPATAAIPAPSSEPDPRTFAARANPEGPPAQPSRPSRPAPEGSGRTGRSGRAGRAERSAKGAPCACPRPDCAMPGAHPHDPGLLAATADARMVSWWWTQRPDAPLLLATGGPVSAVSLPAEAGLRALSALEDLGVRLGPVVATPTRVAMLVEPYSLEELGELLARQDWVPSSLRFHGHGGYVVLPPSRVGGGDVSWVREPLVEAGEAAPWLPRIGVIVDMLVAAGVSAPDGSRLAY